MHGVELETGRMGRGESCWREVRPPHRVHSCWASGSSLGEGIINHGSWRVKYNLYWSGHGRHSWPR